MTRHPSWLFLGLVVLLAACGEEAPPPAPATAQAQAAPGDRPASLADWLPPEAGGGAANPHAPANPHAGMDMGGGGGSPLVRGIVSETMDSGGYTYMLLQTADGPSRWVAARQMPVEVGAEVQATGMVMRDFHSNTLDRTFDQIVFASQAGLVGEDAPAAEAPAAEAPAPVGTHPSAAPALPPGHPPIGN